jgi:bifunctional non-homologous end joining protein LigD
MLRQYQPCIPTRSKTVPKGSQWVHEIKHDGYRMIVRRTGEGVRLFTKGGYDWSKRYPVVTRAAAALKVQSATLDGEIVVCVPDGVSDFARLHSRGYDHQAILYAFDLLEIDGLDLRGAGAGRAQGAAREASERCTRRYSPGQARDGEKLFHAACTLDLEGIVSKRIDMPYQAGSPRRGSRSRIRTAHRAAPK